MKEVWRRIKNFCWGPTTGFQWNDAPPGETQLFPPIWPRPFHWYGPEDAPEHFNKLGIIEVQAWRWIVGLYYVDNN